MCNSGDVRHHDDELTLLLFFFLIFAEVPDDSGPDVPWCGIMRWDGDVPCCGYGGAERRRARCHHIFRNSGRRIHFFR